MYLLNNNDVKEIEETTFANIDMCEKDLEELIRKNINMICDPDDESMLIIGQQVANEKRARSNLTAIDSDGNIVVIEIKRDLSDLKQRKEPVEFQANLSSNKSSVYLCNCLAIMCSGDLKGKQSLHTQLQWGQIY